MAATKKDMSQPMAKAYNPKEVETGWYDWWEKSGFFAASNDPADTRPKFTIVIPPPNVTGSLHIGHALTNSIQDTICRWRRMKGYNTLWVPGTDHAGIATQAVVEKMLKRQMNEPDPKRVLGREAFVAKVWEWKNEYGGKICNQLRRLGSSLDWSREAFTMDENLSRAVVEAFVRMHEMGLIYRSNRLVNWSCKLKTALSDIEVNHDTIEHMCRQKLPGSNKSYEFGFLFNFAYKIEGTEEEIVVATTRPETMLGDTGVAVHPEDPRYKDKIGKLLIHPFFPERRIPIVADAILVKMEFGTGAVKVTPAHDANDFECGKRNNLPLINILTDDGNINENGGPFQGMYRFDAREAVMKALEEKGLARGKEDNPGQKLGKCSRSGDVIEPLLKPQWYVNCQEMGARSVEAVRTGEIDIIPNWHVDTWNRRLTNPRDWCISRQLWWGHRIPAYLVSVKGAPPADASKEDNWVVARSLEDAIAAAEKKFNTTRDNLSLSQDEDVLDTWFSSGLFPFSVMHWPESHPDMTFFPTTLLETGHDILFFWVARMVMMSLTLTNKVPFSKVYLHAMVRDAHGRKMSKSLGNVMDPIDVMEGITLAGLKEKLLAGNLDPSEVVKAEKIQKEEFPEGIEECGADALRFALVAYTSQGRDINLDIKRVVADRHFCNKLWNAVKFGLMHLEEFVPNPEPLTPQANLSLADTWILTRLSHAAKKINAEFEAYEFALATQTIRAFWFDELCAVYLELLKPVMSADRAVPENAARRNAAQNTLYTCLEAALQMLHPFMPFVTEELYHRLPVRPSGRPASIMLSRYPEEQFLPAGHPNVESHMDQLREVIHAARGLLARYTASISSGVKIQFFVVCEQDELFNLCQQHIEDILIPSIGKVGLAVLKSEAPPEGCAVSIVGPFCRVNILLKGLIDFGKEIKKLETNRAKLEKAQDTLIKKRQAPSYAERSPQHVQDSDKEKMEKQRLELAQMAEAIEGMKQFCDK